MHVNITTRNLVQLLARTRDVSNTASTLEYSRRISVKTVPLSPGSCRWLPRHARLADFDCTDEVVVAEQWLRLTMLCIGRPERRVQWPFYELEELLCRGLYARVFVWIRKSGTNNSKSIT